MKGVRGNADAARLTAPRARVLPCLVLQIALVQELLDPGITHYAGVMVSASYEIDFAL